MKHSTDQNQDEIVQRLKLHGVKVVNMSKVGGGMPDLMTCYQGIIRLIELKTSLQSPIRRSQLKFIIDNRNMPIGVAMDFQQALNMAKFGTHLLTNRQKENLDQYLYKHTDFDKISLLKFYEVIENE